MGRIRARAKRDSNEQDLVKIIRQLGGGWLSTASTPGELDGVIGYAGIDQRVEIKDGTKLPSKQKLSEDENRTFLEWQGRKPVVVKSIDDVYKLMNKMRLEG